MDNAVVVPAIFIEAASKETLNKLLRARIAASRARSLLAYPFDMSRRSLRGSLHSGLLATLVQRFPNASQKNPIGDILVP